ncbi:hypothetical protein Avbf_17004, partial [Armadillidium vulgare]
MTFSLPAMNQEWTEIIIGIMFRQNVNIKNKSVWYLLHVIVWIIGSFVIMSAYSGNLISFLTFPSFPKRIETVKELATSNLRIGATYYGSPLKEYLLSSPIEDLRKLGKKFDYYPNTNLDVVRRIELVKSNHLVFLDGNTYMIFLQNSFSISGETYVLKEQILKGYLAFIFKKHSSLTHPISSKLNRLIETGIYSRIYEKHLSKMKKAQRSYKKVNDKKELQIAHLQTAFYALFLGYFISIVYCKNVKKRMQNM